MRTGAFQTSREIFDNPIWQDIPKFRIFFYILGNAVFSDEGVRVGNIVLKRGQYLRSYRNLSNDLEYIENRKIKKYSISVISRKIDQLIKEERLKIEDTELGTLFTIVNYDEYQGFDRYKKELGTGMEQGWNTDGTGMEQHRNNNNKEKKVNKVKKDNKKEYTSKIKDLLSRYVSVDGFANLNKDYWNVIRETRSTGKVAESVIYNNMNKWVNYDPVVVQYSLKTHIEAHAGKKEEYTIGIMRGTSKEDAEDRLSHKPTNKRTGVSTLAKDDNARKFKEDNNLPF